MKVGTKIKIIETCDGCRGAEGKIGVVTNKRNSNGLFLNDPGYNVEVENGSIWRINKDAKVEVISGPDTIVIYRDGQKVIALDKSTGNKAVAKCSPQDEFNFMTGAKLALERLGQNVTFKILALKDYGSYMTRGKVYEFIDGITTWDSGYTSNQYYDYQDFVNNNRNFKTKTIELKDGMDPLEEPKKHTLYSGRVVCVATPYDDLFTVGKIYDVIDGQLTYDNGHKSSYLGHNTTFDKFVKNFASELLEIKE